MLIILYWHNNILISQLEPKAVQWEPGRCSNTPTPDQLSDDVVSTQAHVSQDSYLTPLEYIPLGTYVSTEITCVPVTG